MPTLSISISTLSPGFIHSGGLRRAPTPPGVPVTSTSPGTSVVHADTYSMIFGILKVQAARERHLGSRRDLVCRDHPRPEAAGVHEILAGGPLDGVALPVAHRAVVVAAVAGDVAPRILLRDAPASTSDDHRDLGLEVEVGRFARPDDRLLVADLRLGQADEDRGLLGVVAPGLDDVVLIIEADAEDPFRVRDHRQPGDVGLLVVRRLVHVLGGFGERVAADQRLQIGEAVADVALQVDNALAGDDAVAGSLGGLKGSELHI